MLPYSAEVYAAVLAEYNAAFFPGAPLALVLSAGAMAAALSGRAAAVRAFFALLAAAWIWTGIAFFFVRFAPIYFMAPVYGVVFAVQGAVLLRCLAVREVPALRLRRTPTALVGLALALLALAGYPLQALAGPIGIAAAPVAGFAPGPTALLTLGALLLIDGRTPWLPSLIPLAWCVVGGVSAWIIGYAGDAALPPLAALALGAMVLRNRRLARADTEAPARTNGRVERPGNGARAGR